MPSPPIQGLLALTAESEMPKGIGYGSKLTKPKGKGTKKGKGKCK